MNLAPIILFVYNRPSHTEQTLEALSVSRLANESTLFIFADGPKKNASTEDLNKINEVRSLIKRTQWCKKVHIIESETNKGLADSIISGVTQVVDQLGSVIVLEDDVVVSSGFLQYMNDALRIYEAEPKVMHISGYMYPHNNKKLPETFFYPLPYPGGGWATWKRAWNFFINDADYLYNYFDSNNRWKKFNTDGGTFFKDQLVANKTGTLKTWFIKWHGSILIQNGLTLFPNRSLIYNSGFDGSGVHCGISDKYNWEISKSIIVEPKKIRESKVAKKIIYEFYNGCKPPLTKKLKQIIPFSIKSYSKKLAFKILSNLIPELRYLKQDITWDFFTNKTQNLVQGDHVKINEPFEIYDSKISDYTYVATNSKISKTSIGKFCSIGPNLLCGWGIHPANGISTSPMFYSTLKQNGTSLSSYNKVEERKPIVIGNDVLIGANVTILDGITIGDGAIIGAGAVVSKDIPPYAIAIGCPITIKSYRFSEANISKLLTIKWWDFEEEKLKEIEKMFFQPEEFISKYSKDV